MRAAVYHAGVCGSDLWVFVVPLAGVPAGYEAMDDRRAVKVLVRTGAA